MASLPNVLRVNTAAEQDLYRSAISRILVNIQSEHDLTLLEIADEIGVSLGTVSNAANKKADLSPTFLKRLGEAYGIEILNPYLALAGGRGVPLAPKDADALPPLTAAIHKIAQARSPDSPGGQRETHCELLGMEDEIDDAIAALTALKMRCNEIRLGAAA